ncbi:hypothetical protein Tco_0260825 [Tanacetum coccineum]
MTITSLSLDELIRNLKVHEMIIKKGSEIIKAKVERKSLALSAKTSHLINKFKNLVDEECFTSGTDSGEDDDEKSSITKSCLVSSGSSDEVCSESLTLVMENSSIVD